MKTKYSTEIKIWSRIGYTPITHRVGSFCDVLLETNILVENPEEAKERLSKLMKATSHAASGYYYISEYPNQNVRSYFTHQ